MPEKAVLRFLLIVLLGGVGISIQPVRDAVASQDEMRTYAGRVLDDLDKQPIGGAFVTLDKTVVRTNSEGRFTISGVGENIGIRAYGHQRLSVATGSLANGTELFLRPVEPKALYLSLYGIGHKGLRQNALDLIEATELNAVVIDVKGDRGMIAYKSSLPLAAQAGAQSLITIPDLHGLLADFHARGIYTIARIVVFKDLPLAQARPDLAVRTASGAIYRDREKLAWTSALSHEVWDYNIGVAVEAAKAGFDEIQFDYLRFPDVRGGRLAFPMEYTERNRVATMCGFLRAAREALVPYNVFLAADIFGDVLWNLDDTHIGQRLGDIARLVDYLSPMLDPSGFQFGIPGYKNPVQHPFEIVHLSLDRAQERTHLPSVRFRPWLQAFRDYAFGGRQFGGAEIRAQIDAAEQFGSDGWMLWNPSNRYYKDGLK